MKNPFEKMFGIDQAELDAMAKASRLEQASLYHLILYLVHHTPSWMDDVELWPNLHQSYMIVNHRYHELLDQMAEKGGDSND